MYPRGIALLLGLLAVSIGLVSYAVGQGSATTAIVGVTLPLNPEVADFMKDLESQGALFRHATHQEQQELPPGTVLTPRPREQSAPPQSAAPVVTVAFVRSDGLSLFPRYHFGGNSAQFMLDEYRFRPGYYTLRITATDPEKGTQTSREQEFAWGVLSMNTDQDRYLPGETADIHFGVLDEKGEIICNADLTLTVVAPDGSERMLSTDGGAIEVTGTCGVKEAGFIEPDYQTSMKLDQPGLYRLSLRAVTEAHTTTLSSELLVTSSPPYTISRKAATRLWPFAPSTMEISVQFLSSFSGSLIDRVTDGFAILETNPAALVATAPNTGDTTITWRGSWGSGEVAAFSYRYDAPDISPEFYLVGPLILTESHGISSQELRSWQIANDAVRTSAIYAIEADVIASGGGEGLRSSNYRLSGTIGEPGVGFSRAANYALGAGYRQAVGEFLSLSCFTSLDLGNIPGVGQATGQENCTAISDSDAGYTLSWQVTTGSGGTATGYMISQFERTISPFSPTAPGTPEAWSVGATAAEWGGRLKSASTDSDAKWGTDVSNEKWLNAGTGSTFPLVSRSSRTTPTGSTEQLQFRAEVGSNKVQAAGTYDVTIDLILSSP